MPIKMSLTKSMVPVHIWTDEVEHQALEQLLNVAQLPFVHGHVAAMPDVHAGIGATVGSVIPTYRAIVPAAVGVDIGCGMVAVMLSLNAESLPDNLAVIRADIENAVPVGFDMHEYPRATREANRLQLGLRAIVEKHPTIAEMQKPYVWARQLGSLGGGNHFEELCLDESGNVWVMLHSGSRGIGNVIGRYFIEEARKEMLRLDVRLPDRDLAYFEEGTRYFEDYMEAVGWAQDYAMANRRVMLDLVLDVLRKHLPSFEVVGEATNCHHNYVAKETHYGKEVYVTRKGAIRAGVGDMGIIPGSMGQKSYIVRGKGNPESFCSCSHGAGRRMSRGEAKRRFTVDDVVQQTAGVECRKDAGVIDELPGAYKPIDVVMGNQTDLVDIDHTLKQVLCIKG